MATKSVGEGWLSLEQTSQLLGLPWSTILRWAREGDPRLPAYRIWDETTPQQGSYRFKEQDVDALQAQAPVPLPLCAKIKQSPRPPARRASRG